MGKLALVKEEFYSAPAASQKITGS